jgi:hypothetical protein
MPSPLNLNLTTIEEAIAVLPIQGRIMLRLILLQYFDVSQEEIEYMAADRPDPRCVTGTKPIHNTITKEAIKAVRDKRDEYRQYVRVARERTWLQCECLRQLASLRETMAAHAGQMLESRFGEDRAAIAAMRSQARTALARPAVRVLDQRWESDEITIEDYQRNRLGIELQTHLRLAEKYRKRLDLAMREHQSTSQTGLQDHEIGHIWGIPAGSLAARKVKYLAQYLQALQTAIRRQQDPPQESTRPPLDLWKETFSVLAELPIERSLSVYDGLERTESALLEKLTSFVWGNLTEDIEAKFWLSLVQTGSTNAVHAELGRSLFGLQRLAAILSDLDTSSASIDEALLARVTPRAKTETVLLEEKPSEPVLGEMGEHVLRSMLGESHPDLHGSRRS